MWPLRETYDPLLVFRPRSWLLREGYRLGGVRSAHAKCRVIARSSGLYGMSTDSIGITSRDHDAGPSATRDLGTFTPRGSAYPRPVQAPGTIVVLNGPSSAGKSTLAKATRKLLGTTCMAVATDRLHAFAHPAHPLDARLWATLTDATLGIAVTAATAGFDVIVDTVFERRECLDSARRALAAMQHFYVAVTCPLDKLEARERARGNRPLGLARRQHTEVFYDAPYVLELDTDGSSASACPEQIARLFPRRA